MYDNSLYSSDKDDTWRYTLGKPGKSLLLTIGLNPSDATRVMSDNTVTRVQRIAKLHDYDGFLMLNLYPVRGKDYRRLSPLVNQDAFERNLNKIEEVVAAQSKPVIWAAWGDCVTYHSYFLEARNELFTRLGKYNVQWVRYGELTTKGNPRHPSRPPYSLEFEHFNIT